MSYEIGFLVIGYMMAVFTVALATLVMDVLQRRREGVSAAPDAVEREDFEVVCKIIHNLGGRMEAMERWAESKPRTTAKTSNPKPQTGANKVTVKRPSKRNSANEQKAA